MTELPEHLREPIEWMLSDLRDGDRLTVEKRPAPEPRHAAHGIRVVTVPSPQWYSDFCAAYPKNRTIPRLKAKPDTRIVRVRLARTLRVWLQRGHTPSKYADHLLQIAEGLLAEEQERQRYYEEDDDVPF